MTKLVLTAAAAAALVVSGPAAAQNQSNGQQTREQARQNSQGPDNADQRGVERSNQNSVLQGSGSGQSRDRQSRDRMNGETDMQNRRQNSQGSANANDRGRERANQNSAVTEGMMVHDRNNRMIGRVSEVRRSSTGVIIAIVVVLQVQINGSNTITLPAGSFAVVAGVVIVASITAPSGS